MSVDVPCCSRVTIGTVEILFAFLISHSKRSSLAEELGITASEEQDFAWTRGLRFGVGCNMVQHELILLECSYIFDHF